jgi:hypothetical protein
MGSTARTNAEDLDHELRRRKFLTVTGGSVLALVVGGLLTGCNGGSDPGNGGSDPDGGDPGPGEGGPVPGADSGVDGNDGNDG